MNPVQEETRAPAPPSGDRRTAILGIVLDLALPLGTYVVLRLLSADAAAALAAGSGVAVLRLVWVSVRTRRFDVFGALLLVLLVLSLAFAIVTGEERLLLAKDSAIPALAGLAFLASVPIGRPLAFAAAKTVAGPERREVWNARWAAEPRLRRSFTTLTLVWGGGLLGEALVRLPVVYLVPIDAAVALTTALEIGAIGLLALWTAWYARRHRIGATAE